MITNNFGMFTIETPETFLKIRKQNLNDVEAYGLRHALADFVKEYEEENFGEVYTDLYDQTNTVTDNHGNRVAVDLLDGYYNTYLFEHDGQKLALDYLFMTDNGIMVLVANPISDTDNMDTIDHDTEIYIRLN